MLWRSTLRGGKSKINQPNSVSSKLMSFMYELRLKPTTLAFTIWSRLSAAELEQSFCVTDAVSLYLLLSWRHTKRVQNTSQASLLHIDDYWWLLAWTWTSFLDEGPLSQAKRSLTSSISWGWKFKIMLLKMHVSGAERSPVQPWSREEGHSGQRGRMENFTIRTMIHEWVYGRLQRL